VGTQPAGSEPGAGTITGISQGTLLKTVVQDELTYPAGSRKEVIDGSGAYLPFKIANYDTTYVDLTVNDNAHIKVTAEDGIASIVYQLVPESNSSDAFVTSFIFTVDQSGLLIADIPLGISTRTFMAHLVPAPGATFQLIDKGGFERTDGTVALDDKIVVTSEDGTNTAVYFLDVLAPTQIFFA
jgi:hypothetical protein